MTPMKPPIQFLFLTCFALSTVTFPGAHAEQVYRWQDSKGRLMITDTPPPGQAAKKTSPTPISESKPKSETPPPSLAEQNKAFQERRQASAEKEAKAQKALTEEAEKKEDCQRARRQLASLESGQRITVPNDKGEPIPMDDADKQKEIERTRKQINALCN